ncbi:S1/P1 nuclease [Alistipes onderdonkii]|uniref:S1/P1 nuclease n=1 Tax=Alistipes onderdonkii TaxID=328813 RepID=UPI0034A33625
MKKSFLLLAAMLLCYCGTAFGWGKSGHDAIAYIAECNLTPKARKNIEKYLDGRSIVYYASWMDVYRHTPAYKVTSGWPAIRSTPTESTFPTQRAMRCSASRRRSPG